MALITTNVIDIGSRRPLVVETDTVYFIKRRVSRGAIKIGYARDPWARLADLQIACDVPLAVIATLPGGLLVERALHQRFARYRLRGEWFRPSAELWAFIRTIPDRYDCGLPLHRREERAAKFAGVSA